MNAENRKAIFIDIDGTLTAQTGVVPPENLRAMDAARQRGHAVYINTGRSWGNIPQTVREQADACVDGWIAGNGTHVVLEGETVYSVEIPQAVVRHVVRFITARPELWGILEGRARTIRFAATADEQYGQSTLTCEEDYLRLFADEPIQVIAAGSVMPPDFLEAFRDSLHVYQFPTYADCVPLGNNKAEGMKKVLALTGIRRENTYAIGDSCNDADMVRFAGTGIAMGNAHPSLTALAQTTVGDNHSCGVAEAIRRYLL